MEILHLSFLIPSYNHASYITHTLESIRIDAQGINYEICIIDDGSTDSSREVIDAWRARHPEVEVRITYRENRGVSATLNQLVREARGQIVRICASDDAIYKGSSRRILDVFSSTEAQVLVADAIVIDDTNAVIGDSAIQANGGNIARMKSSAGLKNEIVANWSIPGPCFAIKRLVYDKVGPYAEDLPIEDWDFFLRVAAQCNILFAGGYFSYYRIHGTNTSRTSDVAKRVRNLKAQLLAGRRRAPLFSGGLERALARECAVLELKIAYLTRSVRAMAIASIHFMREWFI